MRLPETQPGAPAMPLEDPLAYLPVSTIGEFRKGEVIYGPGSPPAGIYVVLAGNVKVCREAEDGQQVVVDIYQSDEFFGESAILGTPPTELAAALDSVRVMSWKTKDIQELSLRRPELCFALLQLSVARSVEFGNRIQSFSLENIERRLARALLRFSGRLGSPTDNDGRQMISLTHEFIAQYVGTSREIVTHYMNTLRRKRCLDYSRKNIVVYEKTLNDVMTRGGIDA